MNNEEIKVERWSVCERYKNYKLNNYYKDPVAFRPHPENVVRDVIMYHIYHNEGKLCNDALVQYIKNKIINDLNEIFMLYKYAPDAISTIKRLMSSKTHLGSEDTYNEMMFHALTIKDTRDVLIELISNVLIKCIPEPLGNIKFDVIMKDGVKEETTMSDRETNTADKPFDFAVKSVSGKLYNYIYKIIEDFVNECCDHVDDMTIVSRTFTMFPEVGYNEYKLNMLGGGIGYWLHETFDIETDPAWNEAWEEIDKKFKFKNCLDPKSNEAFIKYLTNFVCRHLSFDKSMELEKEAMQHDQKIETVKSGVKENDHPDKVQEKLVDNNPQRFQVGDLVSFEKHGWYYQSLIHGVCYHEDSKKWSYVIVAFGEFHHIVGDDVDKLTLLKKSKTSINTVVNDNKVERVYRGYITKSQEIKETLLSAVQLIEGISEDDILNLHSLNDYDCDFIETTYNFIRHLIYYVCSYSDNDFMFDEVKGSIVQLEDNGKWKINTPLYVFIEDELKPIIEHQLKLKVLKGDNHER